VINRILCLLTGTGVCFLAYGDYFALAWSEPKGVWELIDFIITYGFVVNLFSLILCAFTSSQSLLGKILRFILIAYALAVGSGFTFLEMNTHDFDVWFYVLDLLVLFTFIGLVLWNLRTEVIKTEGRSK
jgi:hypothetical protein